MIYYRITCYLLVIWYYQITCYQITWRYIITCYNFFLKKFNVNIHVYDLEFVKNMHCRLSFCPLHFSKLVFISADVMGTDPLQFMSTLRAKVKTILEWDRSGGVTDHSLIVAFRWQNEIISLWKKASSQLIKRSPW
jgi:hypothetical protein